MQDAIDKQLLNGHFVSQSEGADQDGTVDCVLLRQTLGVRSRINMVTKLKFKGEKTKKRKRHEESEDRQAHLGRGDEEEQGWVDAESLDDISTGPLFITFSSTPPIAIGCDPLGKVYAALLGKKEGSGDLENFEPEDVRQVWVATRLADSNKISLKTATGKFLSCDKIGILSASKEAIGPQEEWIPLKREDGWALQNVFGKFLYFRPKQHRLTSQFRR